MAEEESYSGREMMNAALISAAVGSVLGVAVGYEFVDAGGSSIEAMAGSIGIIALCWILSGALDQAHQYLKDNA